MKKRFSEEQIIGFLREAEEGMPVKDLCRRHGFSEASYYLWRSKFGGMSVPDKQGSESTVRALIPAAAASGRNREQSGLSRRTLRRSTLSPNGMRTCGTCLRA